MTISLQRSLEALIGLTSWSVVAGLGTGGCLSLGFGEKLPASRFSKNTALSLDDRVFEPEFIILIECAWRLSVKENVVLTWVGIGSEFWEAKLNPLRAARLLSFEVTRTANDLTLQFDDGISLEIFCDQSEAEDNYLVFTRETILAAGFGGRLQSEPRGGLPSNRA